MLFRLMVFIILSLGSLMGAHATQTLYICNCVGIGGNCHPPTRKPPPQPTCITGREIPLYMQGASQGNPNTCPVGAISITTGWGCVSVECYPNPEVAAQLFCGERQAK